MAGQKGSSFERELARQLSLWWSHQQDDTIFWRVLGSGGRATRKTHTGKGTAHVSFGDLEATCPEGFAFTDLALCEFKRGYGRWAITDVLDARTVKTQTWNLFMEQVLESWKASGRRWWIVIFKRDQRKPMIVLCPQLYMWLHGRSEDKCGPSRVAFRAIFHGRLHHSSMSCASMPLDTFLATVQPEVFIDEHRRGQTSEEDTIAGPITKGWCL